MSRNKYSVRSAFRASNIARTPRKPNWSEVECEYLLQEIQKNLPMIRSRKPNCKWSSKSAKADMWNRMCAGLHMKRPTVMRSVADLKDKWKKLQFMAKQYISQIRVNSMTNRTPDGLIVIPKLVYRVLEVRGQDPKKLGFRSAVWAYDYEMRTDNTSAGTLNSGSSSSMEQEAASAMQNLEQNSQGEPFNEEILDDDQWYQENSPNQSELTLQIESAVSLNPAYNQAGQSALCHSKGSSSTSSDTIPTVPVSLERAVSSSQADIRTTSYSISSRLLHQRETKMSATKRSFKHRIQANKLQSQSRSPPHASLDSQLHGCSQGPLSSQPRFPQDSRGDPTCNSVSSEPDHSFSPLDEPQASVHLEADDQPLPLDPGSKARDSPHISAPQSRRLCPAGLMTHICDEQVVELQREVLQEERDKIRLEKEVLEMQREKLKLEMMFLRQKVNGSR